MLLRLTTVFAAALLALAGCGGDGGESDQGVPSQQVLRVNYGTEPPSLDPGLATDVTSSNVISALMDPLVKLGRDLEPVANLAQEWNVSRDGKVVTFHLRGDGKWTNGDPVTASDFVYSWKRAISPELAADYAYQFFGIVGAPEYNGCKKSCERLRDSVGVEAVDDRTLRVELTSPQPWFVQQTAHTSFLPVHRATVEQFGNKWTEPANIVTNGPFRLTAWEHNSSITLEKWDGWRAASTVELERVEGRMIADATTAVQAYEAGEIHACVDRMSCVPADEIERLRDTPDFVRAPGLATSYVSINLDNITDVDQRRAMALAVDRETIVREVTRSGEQPATSFTPEGMPGFEQIRQTFLTPSADVARAKEYLARARKVKRTINLVGNNDAETRAVAVALQSMWKQIGLDTRIRTMEWAQLLEAIGPPPDTSVDAIMIGWVADYVDDINFLELSTCKSGNNLSAYCDPEYDRLVEEARRTSDGAARHALYARLEGMLTGENGAMPLIPTHWATWVILRKPWIEGWVPNPLHQFDYTQVSIRDR